MIINPNEVVGLGIIQGVEEAWVQPNGVDIPANRLFEMQEQGSFILDKNKKTHRDRFEMKPYVNTDRWVLRRGKVYDFLSDVYISMPDGFVGWLITRSTLNRNGAFIISGLYDSGFYGPAAGTIYNFGGMTLIELGARVAQFVVAEAENDFPYDGSYNTKQGDVPEQIEAF